jgi:hypothetical protein
MTIEELQLEPMANNAATILHGNCRGCINSWTRKAASCAGTRSFNND